ncbi:MAG TPA: hypothetical protein PJ982_19695 [Lacipirellulaceae bacterium]|nr:hypothetical protein [Lacipirellulaceae bacterium]
MKTVLLITYLLTACSVFAGDISKEILALSSRTKLKPEQLSVLERAATSDSAEGMLSASILFAHDSLKYLAIFRERCAYDHERKREVVTREELVQKMELHLSGLGKISKLEEDFQSYHYLRKTGYVFLRDDGSEYHIEKVLSSAAFTGLAMARKEKDAMSFVMKMAFESYKQSE